MKRRRNRYTFSNRKPHHPIRNFFLVLLTFTVMLTAAVVIINYGLSHQPRYDRETVTIPDLPDDLENWTILHFSDLHGATFGARQGAIKTLLGNANVSSVVFTGDMVGPDGDVSAVLALAALMPQDKPILFLPGDEDPSYLDATTHSSLSPKAGWALQLEQAGITILDEPMLFVRGNNGKARIWFIPADLYTLDLNALRGTWQRQLDHLNSKLSLTADEAAAKRVAEYQVSRVDSIEASIADMRPGDIQIAVSHIPLSIQEMQNAAVHDSRSTVFSLRQADLILAGHYCGGHVRIPGKGAVYVPGLGNWPDDSQVMGMTMLGPVPQYISPGLASSSVYPGWLSFRFMNQPAFTRITLTSKYR